VTLAAFANILEGVQAVFPTTQQRVSRARVRMGLQWLSFYEELLAETSSCCPVPGTMHGNAMCARLRTARHLAANVVAVPRQAARTLGCQGRLAAR